LFGLGKEKRFRHRPGQFQRCVIFDFDGTVADTYDLALHILHEIADARRTEPPRDIESLRMMSAIEVIRKYRLSVLDLLFFEKKYEDEVYRHMFDVRPFAGLKAVLKKLDKSYGLGIISSNRRENVFAFLHHTGMDKYFDFLETGSSLLGKPRRIRAIMKKHGYRKADVVYVGDEVRDIDAARSVGIKVIAVGWGFNKAKRLKAEKPDFFVTMPSQLVAAVKKAFRRPPNARA
jgi:HAD superfamily hydrolase (TIGR01549 family)